MGLGKRHRPPDVVEHRRRVRPVTADRPHGRLARQGPLAADEAIVGPAHALLAVTRLAFLRIDLGTLRWRSGARRQTAPVGRNADVPSRDLGLRRWTPEIRRLARGGGGGAGTATEDDDADRDG